MSRLYINLNPRKEKVENIIFQKAVSFTPFVAWGVFLFFVIIFMLNLIVIIKSGAYNRLKKEWVNNAEQYKQISEIKTEAAHLVKEEEILRKVTIPATDVVQLLEDIFSALPQNLWFKDLNFQEGKLSLQGYVVAWKEDYLISLVDKFIKPLKERDYFSSKFKTVDLKQSQRKTFYGIEVLEFNIECKK